MTHNERFARVFDATRDAAYAAKLIAALQALGLIERDK